jgi:hypothetical protein
MRKDEELKVITKTYDLILWSCNHTSRFPRNHRFVLGERIERNLYTLPETLIRAKYNKSRQRLLDDRGVQPSPGRRPVSGESMPGQTKKPPGGSSRAPASNAPPGSSTLVDFLDWRQGTSSGLTTESP